VQVVDIDMIGAEAAKAGFAGLDEVVSRRAFVVGALAGGEGGFGGNENLIAAAFDGFAEDFLGDSIGVNIGGVEEVDAGFEANIDEAGGLGDVGRAPGFEKFIRAAKGAGAEAEDGDFEARIAKLSVFHGDEMSVGGLAMRKQGIGTRD